MTLKPSLRWRMNTVVTSSHKVANDLLHRAWRDTPHPPRIRVHFKSIFSQVMSRHVTRAGNERNIKICKRSPSSLVVLQNRTELRSRCRFSFSRKNHLKTIGVNGEPGKAELQRQTQPSKHRIGLRKRRGETRISHPNLRGDDPSPVIAKDAPRTESSPSRVKGRIYTNIHRSRPRGLPSVGRLRARRGARW